MGRPGAAAVAGQLGVRVQALTGRYRPPSEATLRHVLTRIDAAALNAAVRGFLADLSPRPRPDPAEEQCLNPVDGPLPSQGIRIKGIKQARAPTRVGKVRLCSP